MRKYLLSLQELDTLIKDVVENFRNGVVILRGDLAAGKTTFVKRVVKHLGIEDEVTSPTFSLQHCYGERVFHYDIYNHGLEHFISLGMLEELDREGLHFVEWGDDELAEILDSAEIKNMTITIEKISDDKREYTICTH
ncbi:tRNA (adenosine(37)-N6)-threonylcarbamoyltransferase complex ATPase subunit type 1 TsaE [Sulfurimonas sp.]|jgi:tRNA threonylcarbamoyladenosine biosynthesis protein TsaE|uniref:tRNA (adenosine(37)-N6)-threonylcarbamoyltransferase complex ATPase subunit type 1 TsaE n=1 Tax=Sulfurimonas sp. TaxID=2022749 RepID=UPI002A363C91|nr:tRNA (adenosine(37)-N6)-threonylcarbamoyltransferase complex ATPase subunit type 1 TsaE [Sulfurimonas sp.]MDY0123690.1 tRNA (adenosine(37)-N6)-threonylcarbamoyltransferase complex ATPase subunit type 1 TsaE [Sulfurimonas sp.]